MRKIVVTLVLAVATLLTGVAMAQQQQTGPYLVFASKYNNWALPSVSPNTYVFNATTNCIADPYSGRSFNFNTNAPVYVNDLGLDSNSEIVTPSSVINNVGTCGFAASFSHPHVGFQVQSGTAGLQEAINSVVVGSSTNQADILLDPSWFAAITSIGATASTVINSAVGSTKVDIVDITVTPWQFYSWNSVTSKYQGSQNTFNVTLSTGTPATTRAVIGSITTSNATMNLSGNVSLVGVRGLATVPAGTTVTGTQGFIEGGQGKLVVAGTLNGGEWAFGEFGQLDVSAATLTAGAYVAPLAGDFGSTGPAVTCTFCELLNLTNTTGTTLGQAVNIYSKASVAFALNSNGSAMLDSSSTVSGSAIGHILVTINGVAGVIRVYSGS